MLKKSPSITNIPNYVASTVSTSEPQAPTEPPPPLLVPSARLAATVPSVRPAAAARPAAPARSTTPSPHKPDSPEGSEQSMADMLDELKELEDIIERLEQYFDEELLQKSREIASQIPVARRTQSFYVLHCRVNLACQYYYGAIKDIDNLFEYPNAMLTALSNFPKHDGVLVYLPNLLRVLQDNIDIRRDRQYARSCFLSLDPLFKKGFKQLFKEFTECQKKRRLGQALGVQAKIQVFINCIGAVPHFSIFIWQDPKRVKCLAYIFYLSAEYYCKLGQYEMAKYCLNVVKLNHNMLRKAWGLYAYIAYLEGDDASASDYISDAGLKTLASLVAYNLLWGNIQRDPPQYLKVMLDKKLKKEIIWEALYLITLGLISEYSQPVTEQADIEQAEIKQVAKEQADVDHYLGVMLDYLEPQHSEEAFALMVFYINTFGQMPRCFAKNTTHTTNVIAHIRQHTQINPADDLQRFAVRVPKVIYSRLSFEDCFAYHLHMQSCQPNSRHKSNDENKKRPEGLLLKHTR